MNSKELLIIFTKNPVLGTVKTRLAKDIGDEKALQVYKELLQHTCKVTAPLNFHKRVYYNQEIPENDIWDEGNFEKKLQISGDLGEKMNAAFAEGFRDGYENVIIMGSDLLDISTIDIEAAFNQLKHHDYIIGPALDGGYYMLGMKTLTSKLFKNKNWSTSSVYKDTISDMQNGQIGVLPEKNDIDTLKDLQHHPHLNKIIE
ncbi:TIGR04282 family arsenosugar biosynthesis glycosyltransferase [Christiangramia aquimixticola]|uniref:TIGR04282 family arsenosugar biosynthesis glycosyltransferase n=1 Tax=Christiangramia aquimixticola TaxID=1697558 RepID=UPI003AA8FDF1